MRVTCRGLYGIFTSPTSVVTQCESTFGRESKNTCVLINVALEKGATGAGLLAAQHSPLSLGWYYDIHATISSISQLLLYVHNDMVSYYDIQQVLSL